MRATPPAVSQITVDNGAVAGQVSVTNHGPGPVNLAEEVIVESLESGKWITTAARVFLVSDCDEKVGTSVRLDAGQTLRVVAWNGQTCDGQCPRACRANVYLGPGEFRFVVHSVDGKVRIEGAMFRLPRDRG